MYVICIIDCCAEKSTPLPVGSLLLNLQVFHMLCVHVSTNMRMNEGSVCMVGSAWWFEKQHLSNECTTLCVVWKHLAVIILTVLCRVTLRCANCLNVLMSVVLNVPCHSILKGNPRYFPTWALHSLWLLSWLENVTAYQTEAWCNLSFAPQAHTPKASCALPHLLHLDAPCL